MAELVGHTSSVVSVAFHPTVLLLATASADHTVRLYDLENFTQVAVSGPELNATTVRRIVFHPNGVCLYVATNDHLRIYDYESMSCLETVHVGWRGGGGLDDMAVAPSFNQLVGVCLSNSVVTTYVVDIKSCIPFNTNSNDHIIDSSKSSCAQLIRFVIFKLMKTSFALFFIWDISTSDSKIQPFLKYVIHRIKEAKLTKENLVVKIQLAELSTLRFRAN
ncbi:unnamed protein product [Trichobilharzia regenti]|nr:unnamed protein product [Trichobilharzia regenti]